MKDSKKPPFSPHMFFFVSIFLMLVLHKHFAGIDILSSRIGNILGFLFLIFGMMMVFKSFKILMNHNVPFSGDELPNTLIKEGPFSYCRNPVYLGYVITLFGIFCFLGTSIPLIVVFAFGGIIENHFIIHEEKALESKFGASYVEYKKSTPRWFFPLTVFAWDKNKKK